MQAINFTYKIKIKNNLKEGIKIKHLKICMKITNDLYY